jgi:hypothetical protein
MSPRCDRVSRGICQQTQELNGARVEASLSRRNFRRKAFPVISREREPFARSGRRSHFRGKMLGTPKSRPQRRPE